MIIKKSLSFYLLLGLMMTTATPIALSATKIPITPAKGVDIQEILRKVDIRQKEIKKEVTDVTYLAKTVYKEMDKDGNPKKEVLIQKRVYKKNDDRQSEEFISMVIDGKTLNKEEVEKEATEWQKNNSKNKGAKSPLDEECNNDYIFKLLGSSSIGNHPVWVIEFKSKKEEENYINGKAYILKDKYDIAQVDFAPAKIPSVIRNIGLSLTYSDIQGYWLLTKFQMSMRVNVKFIFSVYYKDINVEDLYYQHKINTGLDDSLFGS